MAESERRDIDPGLDPSQGREEDRNYDGNEGADERVRIEQPSGEEPPEPR